MFLFAVLYDHLKRVSLPEVVPKVNIEGETIDLLLFEEMDWRRRSYWTSKWQLKT